MCSCVAFFSVIFMCVQVSFATYFCADDMCSRLFALFLLTWEKSPKCKTTNENEIQITFNCVSLLVCFHAFLMCFPFVVCSGISSMCVHVWCFFFDFHVCPVSFCGFYLSRRRTLSPLCAFAFFLWEKSPNVRKPMNMKAKSLSIVFPFGVFSCLFDVFSLCCVLMCLFDMCSRVAFFL